MEYFELYCRRLTIMVLLVLLYTISTYSWGSTGHQIINLKAPMHLPNSMTMLKSDSLFFKAHASDADYRKDYNDTSFFAEAQRHFIDIDNYPSYHNLPHSLDSVITLYGRSNVRQNGTLPWAIQMVFDSLTAQLRRMDTSTAKFTMSDIGHYVADAHQPLHCTRNYDGQFTNNAGIHSQYESWMINTYVDSIIIVPDSIHYITSTLDFIFNVIYNSNALVDSVLQADTYARALSGWNGSGIPPLNYYTALWEKTRNFTRLQFQRATVALASFWYTAWVDAGNSTSVSNFANVLPEVFRLEQNYPNPFNASTTIRFEIPTYSHVSLKVYSQLGQEVSELLNKNHEAGKYKVRFDASKLSSGIYFYRVQSGNYINTQKMLLIK